VGIYYIIARMRWFSEGGEGRKKTKIKPSKLKVSQKVG
jgi:hypothetical protein